MDFYLISYDIPDDKRRTKIANLLEDYGQRVQFSVFEVWLEDSMRQALIDKLNQRINPDEDSVRLYGLCAACQKKVIPLGLGKLPEAPRVVII
jgi:CRISPR-associated protein Cas2